MLLGIFCAACFATPLQDELHKPLQRVISYAKAKIIVRQVDDDVTESAIQFYFSAMISDSPIRGCVEDWVN